MSKLSKALSNALICLLIVGGLWVRHYEQASIEDRLGEFVRKSEFEIQAINMVVSNAIWVRWDGQITNANPDVAKMFGYTVEEMKGKAFGDLIDEFERAEKVSNLIAAMRDPVPVDPSSVTPDEFIGLRKDGTTFPVESRMKLMDTNAGRYGMTIITEKKKIVEVKE